MIKRIEDWLEKRAAANEEKALGSSVPQDNYFPPMKAIGSLKSRSILNVIKIDNGLTKYGMFDEFIDSANYQKYLNGEDFKFTPKGK